jgi:2-polyprenyl-6-methoxyphenol hydroxylase-like FAD-dependent oxidoreductase
VNLVVVGAGPTGAFLALALARRGHRVTVAERDPRPDASGDGASTGVPHLHQPHGFRPQVVEALRAELPDVLDAVRAAGAWFVPAGGSRPAGSPSAWYAVGMRRDILESALWRQLRNQHRVTVHAASARSVHLACDGRVVVSLDNATITADLVVNATGAARFPAGRSRRTLDADSGFAYANRQYRVVPHARSRFFHGGTLAWNFAGYAVMVFPHDNDIVSVLFVRRAGDRGLRVLRETSAFEAAAAAVPQLAALMSADTLRPVSPVRVGARSRNVYRSQTTVSGDLATPGVVHVGDAMMSLSPMGGRGIATSFMQARKLIEFIDAGAADPARQFGDWCDDRMLPWFHDQVLDDAGIVRLWEGRPLETDGSLPSSIIAAAAAEEPLYRELIDQYRDMRVLPSALQPLVPHARARLAGGWRPVLSAGPDRGALLEAVRRAA